MIDDTDLTRLAAMAHALRPDWPTRSLLTFLHAHHAARPYRDLAVALAWVAADTASKTPARLGENGPWWQAVLAGNDQWATRTPPHAADMRCPRCDAWLIGDETRTHNCRDRADPDHARTMRDTAKAAAAAATRPAVKETVP